MSRSHPRELPPSVLECNYTKAYGEPLHQSSFKCNLGILRWLVILTHLRLWNRLTAPADVAFKTHATSSFTVPTKQDPGYAILTGVRAGARLPGLSNSAMPGTEGSAIAEVIKETRQYPTSPWVFVATGNSSTKPAARDMLHAEKHVRTSVEKSAYRADRWVSLKVRDGVNS